MTIMKGKIFSMAFLQGSKRIQDDVTVTTRPLKRHAEATVVDVDVKEAFQLHR